MPLKPLPFSAPSVRRLERPSLEELREWHYREPVIVRGLLEDSGLLGELRSRSTLDGKLAALEAQLGERPHYFCVLPPESRGQYRPKLVENHADGGAAAVPEEGTFADFAGRLKAAVETGEYVYMQNGMLEQSHVREKLRFDFLRFTEPRGVESKFWIGSDGQVVNLHYDDCINFICMFEGTKRVTMFPPEQLANLYHAPFDVLAGGAPTTSVQLLNMDLERHPRFRTAMEHACVAVVEPGEALLIPPFWWHHVESFGAMHVMVNSFITTIPSSATLELWKDLSAGVRALARATPEERSRERDIFRRRVFGNEEGGDTSPLAEQARKTFQALPRSWREHVARLWEAFAFQTHGTPFEVTPGGIEGLLERQAGQLTLYPNANMLAEMPDVLELPQGDPDPR
ncbi:cupin-like domain-containing protein [Myxococcus sp. CA033]|uniref:cupin-like domain-containing protein n=1 Tax=Myxococcus sp. CA033 TaxID=2741516 RepID=UPI00157A236F|nr:cupin-like domain-containing protein [Myxococcus sp. CA033]NTX36089.1 cupin-like domain-containing protein [Myxococcus sp. CA033]